MRLMLSLVLTVFIMVPVLVGAFEKLSPINVELVQNNGQASITLDIPKGWKVYAHKQGDTGLTMKIDLSGSANLKGHSVQWPDYKTLVEEDIGGRQLTYYYDNKIAIPLILIPTDASLPIRLQAKAEFGACGEYCVMDSATLNLVIPPGTAATASLLAMVLMALTGGLVLNFMPCVLPVLSLKAIGLLKHSGQSRAKITSGLLTTVVGIIFSFIVLAIATIIMKNSGEAVGWGLHFQEPAFIIFIILTLVVFAANLLGDYEINLPVWLNGLIDRYSPPGATNSFLSGVFATLLATPCTAPFVTTAVAFAISQGNCAILAIFFFLGVGMGSPYLVLAAFPQALYFLPKPGRWMVMVKKFFAMLLLITAVWLTYALSGQLGAKPALILVCSLVLLKFILRQSLNLHIKVLLLALVVTSAFIMPLTLNGILNIKRQFVDSAWEEFDEARLEHHIAQGKIVFLDVTAEWCLTCKVSKFLVLDDPDLIRYLQDRKVVLMRADLTNRNPAIIHYMQKRHHSGIPYNVVFSPRFPAGMELPLILRRHYIVDAVESQLVK